MKIVVFCAYFFPHEGGVERYVFELFKGMPGIDVTIVTSNTENALRYEEKFGFKIYRLACWHLLGKTYPVIKPSGLRFLRQLDIIHKKEKFDYVFTNTRFFNTSLVGYCFAKRNKIPLIHIEHGTNHSKLTNPFYRLVNVVYDHTIGRYIIKNCKKLASISKAAGEFSRHLYDRNYVLVRNSIDTTNFKKSDSREIKKLKKDLGIKDQKVIVYVGRLIYAKGVQDLLLATKNIKDLKVVIVGDGNYLRNLANISKNAIFVGRKSQKEIAGYLSIADLFVNPSYAEGLPTSVLEAGAIGVPVIATDVGGTNEIIDDGKNGFLIKPHKIDELKSAIDLILYDNKRAEIFGKTILKKVKTEFDWSTARNALMKLVKFK